MGHHGVGRLYPADKAPFGRDQDKLDCDQGAIDVVLTLGDEPRLQRRDPAVIALVNG